MREMKDSGVEWIGKIPRNWTIVPLKHLLSNEIDSLRVGPFGSSLKGTDFVDEGYWVYNQRTVLDCDMKTNDTFISEEKYHSMTGFKIRSNDILITTRGTIGKVCRIPQKHHKGIIHPCIIKFRIDENKILYPYLELIFNSSGLFQTQLIYKSNATTIEVIYSGTLKNLLVPIPANITLQSQISKYLMQQCAEIDNIINSLQHQIELLQEYKQSVITEAVTKGLDKNVAMKDTESTYWKAIPQNWKLVDIKYLFEIVKRIAGKEGYNILSITQRGIKRKDISKNEGQIAENYSNYQFVYPGDFAMNHMDLLTGWVDLSNMFGVTSPDYRVFRLRDVTKNERRYWKYVMQLCYMCRIFYSIGQGVSNLGRWRLQTSVFNDFKLPVPPFEEQLEIAEYLDSKIMEIESIISDKQKQLDTLTEYKKSLIYEYVTGKKEVPADA